MAYTIGYGVQPQERRKVERKSRFFVLVLLFFVVFLVGVQLFCEDGAAVIRQMLLPIHSDTAKAFEVMVCEVRDGTPVSEAVTAFCREVIQGANLP